MGRTKVIEEGLQDINERMKTLEDINERMKTLEDAMINDGMGRNSNFAPGQNIEDLYAKIDVLQTRVEAEEAARDDLGDDVNDLERGAIKNKKKIAELEEHMVERLDGFRDDLENATTDKDMSFAELKTDVDKRLDEFVKAMEKENKGAIEHSVEKSATAIHIRLNKIREALRDDSLTKDKKITELYEIHKKQDDDMNVLEKDIIANENEIALVKDTMVERLDAFKDVIENATTDKAMSFTELKAHMDKRLDRFRDAIKDVNDIRDEKITDLYEAHRKHGENILTMFEHIETTQAMCASIGSDGADVAKQGRAIKKDLQACLDGLARIESMLDDTETHTKKWEDTITDVVKKIKDPRANPIMPPTPFLDRTKKMTNVGAAEDTEDRWKKVFLDTVALNREDAEKDRGASRDSLAMRRINETFYFADKEKKKKKTIDLTKEKEKKDERSSSTVPPKKKVSFMRQNARGESEGWITKKRKRF